MSLSPLKNLLLYVILYRRVFLETLRPFDITNLLAVIRCEIIPSERERYINIMDDIFNNTGDLALIKTFSITIRIFGSDLEVIKERLRNP